MNWAFAVVSLMMVGSLFMGNGGLILDAATGERDAVGTSFEVIGNIALGASGWDRLGADTVSKGVLGAYDYVIIGLVVLVYILLFKGIYKLVGWTHGLMRKKGTISKERENLLHGAIAVAILGILTLGFEFPRALLSIIGGG